MEYNCSIIKIFYRDIVYFGMSKNNDGNLTKEDTSTSENDTSLSNNSGEYLKRGLKYILEWLVIVLAARLIPKQALEYKEIFMIAAIGAIAFAILDIYSPSVSVAAKRSVGLAVGMRTLAG